MDAGASADLGEFVRAWGNLWSCDAALGLGATRPSDSCLGCLAGCVWWGVVSQQLVSGTVRCRRRQQRRRRGASCWRRGGPRASVAFVGERRRSAAGARHDFSRAVRRVARRDVVDALCGRGVVMRRAGRCDSIASRPARRFADDDRSDLVVVTCFCLVSECVSGVSECMKA